MRYRGLFLTVLALAALPRLALIFPRLHQSRLSLFAEGETLRFHSFHSFVTVRPASRRLWPSSLLHFVASSLLLAFSLFLCARALSCSSRRPSLARFVSRQGIVPEESIIHSTRLAPRLLPRWNHSTITPRLATFHSVSIPFSFDPAASSTHLPLTASQTSRLDLQKASVGSYRRRSHDGRYLHFSQGVGGLSRMAQCRRLKGSPSG